MDRLDQHQEGERKSHGHLDRNGAQGSKRCKTTKATGESGDKTYWHSLHLGVKKGNASDVFKVLLMVQKSQTTNLGCMEPL